MISRRGFIVGALAMGGCAPAIVSKPIKKIAVTMDDFSLGFDLRLNPRERNERILETFEKHKHKAAGFVTGRFVDSVFGNEIVQSWSDAGHMIGNHTYSHMNSSQEEVGIIKADILKNDVLLSKYASYEKIFRFPFLAEGGTPEKVGEYRNFLAEHRFQNAAVTVDSIDWFTTDRMEKALKVDGTTDLEAYRTYYVNAVVILAEHFHNLAEQLGYTGIPHAMLMHHNILNALFMDDVLVALREQGWSLVDAKEAFADPFYSLKPETPTRGRSLLSVLAQEQGITDTKFPSAYRGFGKKTMDALGL